MLSISFSMINHHSIKTCNNKTEIKRCTKSLCSVNFGQFLILKRLHIAPCAYRKKNNSNNDY